MVSFPPLVTFSCILILTFQEIPHTLINIENILVSKHHTDSTKINRPEHNLHMYRTNFRQPTAHVQLSIFEKTL